MAEDAEAEEPAAASPQVLLALLAGGKASAVDLSARVFHRDLRALHVRLHVWLRESDPTATGTLSKRLRNGFKMLQHAASRSGFGRDFRRIHLSNRLIDASMSQYMYKLI